MPLLRRLLSSVGGLTIIAGFAVWLAYEGWMAYEAPRRLEPGLVERAEREGRIPVVVRLAFQPERFHVLKIQNVGRVGRVSGNTIELRSIDAQGIRDLSRRYYWIARIESAPQAAMR